MARRSSAVLEFDPALRQGQKKALRDGLSAVVLVGESLWVANDETLTLERLTRQGRGGGAERYAGHRQFALSDFIKLPVPPPDDPRKLEEADVEGLYYSDGYLWMIGSHGLKRRKPKEGRTPEENFKRLEKVNSDGNRYLLARIPLVPEEGGYTLARTAELEGRRLSAATLRGDERGNDLVEALRQDKHLGAFLTIPGKDNGVDVEGLAVAGKRLFIGLRGPVLRGWALVLEVEPEEERHDTSTLRLKKIGPGGRHYLKHFLDLDGLGIRDLAVDGSDLLILAGPTMVLQGAISLFRWPKGAEQQEGDSVVFGSDLSRVLELPVGEGDDRGKDQAEGFTLLEREGARSLLVVYDSASERRKKGEIGVEADIFPL